jgi:UDP-MurNAc hydroxylase
MDMNDCKVSGWPLRQILKRHPRVDFVLRSHSSAQPYPFCVHAEDPDELKYRDVEDYMREFVDTARLTRARYAIPFASNHCFLHRETWRFNSTVVSPLDVQRYFERHKPESSKCVVMVPGDSWSDRTGFTLQEQDFFTNRGKHLAAYAADVAPILEKTYAKEARARLEFSAFETYFRDFMRSLPRLARLVFKPVIAWSLSNRPGAYWVLDFHHRKIYETPDIPRDLSFRIEVHEAVLKDCIQKRMFATWTPSKRLAVHLTKGKLRDLFVFLQLVDMHEYGYFPLRKMLRWRFISRWAVRYREIGQYVALLSRVVRTRNKASALKVMVPKISTDESGP